MNQRPPAAARPLTRLRRLALLPAVAVLLGAAEAPVRPNVIIVVVDSLRADYLGCYGFPASISPHLDAFSRKSVLFENCLAQAPWTLPSVASFFTSLDVPRVWVSKPSDQQKGRAAAYKKRLPLEARTLAETFQSAGYRTAAFSRNDLVSAASGYLQGFESTQMFLPSYGPGDERCALSAVNWIREHGKGKPYFMYVHFMDVHGTYKFSRSDYDRLRKAVPVRAGEPKKVAERPGKIVFKPPTWMKREHLDELRTYRAGYAAGVAGFDRIFGTFMEGLEKSGVFTNSVVVVMADHGEELYDHKRWFHDHSLHRELLHVPLMIRTPGGEKVSKRVSEMVGLIDLFPTLTHLAGIGPVAGLEGVDLMAVSRGQRRRASARYLASGVITNPYLFAYESSAYKLIWDYPYGVEQLFLKPTDLRETKDVGESRTALRQEARDSLARRLYEVLAPLPFTITESADPAETEELKEKLKSLGYMQ